MPGSVVEFVSHCRQPSAHVGGVREVGLFPEVFSSYPQSHSAMTNGSLQGRFIRHIIAYHDGPPALEDGQTQQRFQRRALGDVPRDHLDDVAARAEDEVIRTASNDSFQRRFELRLDRRREAVVYGNRVDLGFYDDARCKLTQPAHRSGHSRIHRSNRQQHVAVPFSP